MAITEIAVTTYPAKDVRKLRDWYRDVLGLSFNAPFEESGSLKYDEAQIGGTYFGVMTTDWSEVESGSASGVVFEVEDIEKTKHELDGRGVKTEDIYETPICRLTSFRDPEGNKVTLHQSTD